MLALQHVSRRYGGTVALDDLSLEVAPGHLVGFVGPNGAGKTTAMRIALGVLEPDDGVVLLGGRPADRQARRRIGYMPEERGLYPRMGVRRQLVYLARLHGLGAAAAQASAERWLERLGLAERARDRVDALSLGNQQRVQLCAALVHDPELLVLDEPFSGLDPVGVDVLSEVLRERTRAGVGVLFSSHQLELVERLCDAVSIISAGRVVAQGPVEQLRRRGRRTLRVVVEGAPTGWWDGVPGVLGAHAVDDAAVLVELTDDADDQALLDAARSAGRVRHFAAAEVRLADLFREVVAA